MAKKNQDLITQDRKWRVYKSNDLIQRSRYSLPLTHQKVLLYIISRIKPQDVGNEVYTFSIEQFCSVAGLNVDDGGYYYKKIKEIITDLGNANPEIMITMHDEHGNYKRPFTWLNHEQTKIYEGSGKITIGFSSALQPYLFDLQSNYTQYQLQEILPYRSKYSIRLYELLKSYAFGKNDFQMGIEKEINYTPDEIRIRLDAENYTKYRDLKQRAILPAVEEINRYSEEIHIRIEEVKTGNKVTQILFLIRYAPGRQVLDARTNRENRLER